MNIDEFVKSVSNSNKIKILVTLDLNKQISMFDMKKYLDIDYKNIHKIFQQLESLSVIERLPERLPPRFAIKYKLTAKGKKILDLLEVIKNTN